VLIFLRAMGVAREASASNLVRTARRDPVKEGARTARTSGDKRLRERKGRGGEPEFRATTDNVVKEGRNWAETVFKKADQTIETFLRRTVNGGEW